MLLISFLSRTSKAIFVHGFQVSKTFSTMPPNRSKRSASEDSTSDSGPDDRNPPPKKSKPADKGSSKKPSTKSSSNEEEHSWALDRNRLVKVREFRGKLFVDIREYYEKNGETLPGKKGISLSMGQWNKLKELIDDIQESVEKLG